jgi:hypothetical protein
VKTQLPPLPNDRTSRLIVSVAVGVLVLALVVMLACLVADDDSDSSSRRCPGVVGTVDPVTCLPYGSGGVAAPGTNHSGSSAQKPAQRQPKAPAVKVPTAPKAPAAPPRVSLGKR